MNSDKREPLDFSPADEPLTAASGPEIALDEDFDLPMVELVEADATPPVPAANESEPPPSPKALPAPSSIPATRAAPPRLVYGLAAGASVLWAALKAMFRPWRRP